MTNEHIYTMPNILSADEFRTGLMTAIDLAKAEGHSINTIYFRGAPMMMTLEQETLSDGSKVMNLIVREQTSFDA